MMKMAIIFAALLMLVAYPVRADQKVLAEDFMGDQIEVKFSPYYFDGKLSGYTISSVTFSGEVGTSFFDQHQCYSLPPSPERIDCDEVLYRLDSLMPDNIVEIARLSESNHWNVDIKTKETFMDLARKIEANQLTKEELKYLSSNIAIGGGILDLSKRVQTYKQERHLNWAFGLLDIEDEQVKLKPDKKFSNRFRASFAE